MLQRPRVLAARQSQQCSTRLATVHVLSKVTIVCTMLGLAVANVTAGFESVWACRNTDARSFHFLSLDSISQRISSSGQSTGFVIPRTSVRSCRSDDASIKLRNR
ncbi:hypothetical protein EJ04DRAFT_297920 [Polyplosphaeria fusca]|uniref:Uncharacterized protein n=1 Tax=Polyplosphaeria fusca TaxID=682080 RepID=A0A9P4QV37_9PLEO|nr:hypothetical protein EJ04DRAFT_297920 [Polyplosphaeria fusca]